MDKELRRVLKLGIKTLVFQEVRLLRLGQVFTPEIVMDEISRSIEETKNEIVRLTKTLRYRERTALLRRMIRQVVDEEIDRAIQFRQKRCLRCIHGRFYDLLEVAYPCLPMDEKLPRSFGCDQMRPALRKTCRRFVEVSTAHSLGEYLDEITFLYEFREMIDQMEEVWKDYFLR